MMERRASQEIPIDLIESGQFLSAEEMFSERRTDDPLEMVIRAEVEMYFGRLDEAASLLQQVAPRAAEIDVAARFSRTRTCKRRISSITSSKIRSGLARLCWNWAVWRV